MKKSEVDKLPLSEQEHFMQCPVCSEWFDMRDLSQVFEHQHAGLSKPPEGIVAEKVPVKKSLRRLPHAYPGRRRRK